MRRLRFAALGIGVLLASFTPGLLVRAATPGPPATLSALTPLNTTLNLQPGADPGGDGEIAVQKVIVSDAAGEPVPGVSVTFSIDYQHPVYAYMPPYGASTWTAVTDANGKASSANNQLGYEGHGWQAYAGIYGVTRTLHTIASVAGLPSLTFNTTIVAVPSPALPLTLRLISGDKQTVQMAASAQWAGGEANAQPLVFEVKDANGKPVQGTTLAITGSTSDTELFNMAVSPGSGYTTLSIGANGRATLCCLDIVAYKVSTRGSYSISVSSFNSDTNPLTITGSIVAVSPPPPPAQGSLVDLTPGRGRLQLGQGWDVGGEGYMTPQSVRVVDASDRPMAGVTVQFSVNYSHPVYGNMPPYGATTITRVTGADGVASASNTALGYEGTGFQVYSIQRGALATLTVTAQVANWTPLSWQVDVASLGASLSGGRGLGAGAPTPSDASGGFQAGRGSPTPSTAPAAAPTASASPSPKEAAPNVPLASGGLVLAGLVLAIAGALLAAVGAWAPAAGVAASASGPVSRTAPARRLLAIGLLTLAVGLLVGLAGAAPALV